MYYSFNSEVKLKKISTLVFALSLLCSISSAQFKSYISDVPPTTSFLDNLSNDGTTFYNVGINFFKSPLNFTADDYYLSALVLGATALSSSLDYSLQREVAKTKSQTMDNITIFGERLGNPQYGTLVGGALYLGGHLIGDKYLRETGQILVEAILFNGIVTQVMKMTFRRMRPDSEEGNYDFGMFEFESEAGDDSFPSGHTSTAFTIATVLSKRIDNTYASILLYSMAGLTAYQRVYANRHWFSDTVLGAVLGTVIGNKIVSLHLDQTENNSARKTLNLSPYIAGSTYGLGIQLNF